MPWNNGNGMSGGGYVLMAVIMVVVIVAVAAGIVALVRYTGGAQSANSAQPYPNTPEQILASRLARGEIDNDEYQLRLDTLHGHTKA